MKPFIYLTLIWLFSFPLFSQNNIIQEGTARELNSGKKPIPGVSIHFSDAQSEVSDGNGLFRLVFQDKKPGDLIFLEEIRKRGYELVNEKDFEIVKISNTAQLGVDIILAVAGTVDAAKKEYYDVSDEALLAGFNREKRGLQKALQEARISQQEYLDQLTSVQEAYDHQKEQLDALAEKFARVNFDDVEPYYEEALTLFKAGKIDQAIEVLESADPAKRTQQILQEEKRIVLAQAELDSQKVALEREKRKQIAAVRLLADMYSLKFDPLKAEKQFDQLVALDSTDLDILIDAADFYREFHNYFKAKKAFQKIISHEKAEIRQVANAYMSIGDCHMAQGALNLGLKAYEDGFAIYQKLNQQYPNPAYKTAISGCYMKIGEAYDALEDDSTMIYYYEETFNISKELIADYPQDTFYLHLLAVSHWKLGVAFKKVNNYDQASSNFEKSIEIMKSILRTSPHNVECKNNLAIAYSQLAHCNFLQGNYDKVLLFAKKRLNIGLELVDSFPQNLSFQIGKMNAFGNLGVTFYFFDDIESSLSYLEPANKFAQELYLEYPQAVNLGHSLALSYARLGYVHKKQESNKKEALPYFEKAEEILIEIVKIAPEILKFHHNLLNVQEAIKELKDEMNTEIALDFFSTLDTFQLYELATEICASFKVKRNLNESDKLSFANALDTKAWFGFFLQKFNEGENDMHEAIKLLNSVDHLNINLAHAYFLQGKYREALIIYETYKDRMYDPHTGMSYSNKFLEDLRNLEEGGAIPETRKRELTAIRKILNK